MATDIKKSMIRVFYAIDFRQFYIGHFVTK